jgi:NADH-quinone oxidoreductase subunit N
MSAQELAPLSALIFLVAWACLLLLAEAFIPRRRYGVIAGLASVGLLGALVLEVAYGGRTGPAFGGMIVVDGFATFLNVVFLISGLASIAVAYGYLRRVGIERREYYPLLLFSVSGMLLMAHAADLIVVFLALELLSIPLYVLSGIAHPRLDSEEAALKYFLLGTFATGFLIFGIALTYGAAGSTELTRVFAALQGFDPPGMLLAGIGLILIGLGFKVAAVPFHMWTPDVYHGSPSSVVAFMTVGAKLGGFAALLRVFVTAFPQAAPAWAPTAAWLAAATMVWGNVAALTQSSIKRMLAYSSIAHAGYALMALASAQGDTTLPAVRAALFYLMAYALTSLGAWAVVAAVERADGAGLEIDDFAGLGSRRPGLALAMAVFMLSLTGVPPTAGFLGKFVLFQSAIDAGLLWLAIVGVVTSLISAAFYLRVVVVLYMRPGQPEVHADAWLAGSIALTAAATLLLGLVPGPVLGVLAGSGLMPGAR